jgi:hypothetical protein
MGTPLRWFCVALALLGVGMGCGCQSFKNPPDNSLASVTITNRSTSEISGAIQKVFESHYFQGGPIGPDHFVYERPGSRMNDLAYGSYLFKEKVTVRVTLDMRPIYGNQVLLSCNAALIEDADDPVFKDTHHIRSLQKWPYQDLLKDIKQQLGQ